MEPYRRKIKQEARRRGIAQLFHFTPYTNAESILINGLVSREILFQNGVQFDATGECRRDGRLDAVSVSIHSINKSMFKTKQRNSHVDWLIFELNASILWTHRCRFCWTNAASSEILRHTGFMEGPWAFAKMFENREGDQAECEPTNNGAEVQVLETIAPDHIVDVTVKSHRVKDKLEALMRKVDQVRPVIVFEEIFL